MKNVDTEIDSDMLDEYDFSNGVRGKYAAWCQGGTNVVRLDDDVAAMFSNAAEVNEVLRYIGKLIQRHTNVSLKSA